VAGFVGERPPEHLWDVLLDLTAGTVAVADAAASDFAMTPLHKGVAKAMLAALAADGASDASVAAAVAAKGAALLAQVREVVPAGRLDSAQEAAAIERLRAAGLPEASQRFARALARAE
jgi:hypothetical protein